MADEPWKDFTNSLPSEGGAPWQDFASTQGEKPHEFGWRDTWPVKLYEGIKSAVTLPRDVYQGKVDPLSEEGLSRARELAGVANPLPAATRAGIGWAGSPVTKTLNPLVKPLSPALESAANLGVDVPRYMATEGETLPRIAQGAKAMPWAGEPIVEAAQGLREQLGEVPASIAAPTSPVVAGGSAKEALVGNITKESKKPVAEAYENVESLFDVPSARVSLNSTRAAANKIMADRENANIAGESGAVKAITKAINDPEGMNYSGIKALRSYLGERTPQELVAEGISPTEAKFLYGPLTEDLRSAVSAAGGKPAVDAWEAANTLARSTAAQRKSLAKIVGVRGDASPELVFSRLEKMAGSTSTADIAKLAAAKQAMGPTAWGDFSNAIITRLGRDTQGNFSPDRFVTAYSKLTPAAKTQLFSQSQASKLDDLFKVSNLVKDRITKFENSSRTTHTGLAAALFLHPLHMIASIAGGRGVANYLASPAVVDSARRLARAQVANNATKAISSAGTLASVMEKIIPQTSLRLTVHPAPASDQNNNTRREGGRIAPKEHSQNAQGYAHGYRVGGRVAQRKARVAAILAKHNGGIV